MESKELDEPDFKKLTPTCHLQRYSDIIIIIKLIIIIIIIANSVKLGVATKSTSHIIYIFSKNLVVYYCKCCNLIGYATRYVFVISKPS